MAVQLRQALNVIDSDACMYHGPSKLSAGAVTLYVSMLVTMAVSVCQ